METENATVSGCAHYIRKSKFLTPCCKMLYTCRFCHDEKEDHTLNRKAIRELLCSFCGNLQPVDVNCQNCGIRFGKYACLECNLFDDEDKQQFHCEGCGICRIGGEDNYFHCLKCNTCLSLGMLGAHKCIENVTRTNCPVCLEDLHTSRIPCYIPRCGHFLHPDCYHELAKAGHHACPTCQESMK